MNTHLPAEFEPHQATWLAWPSNPETWPQQMAQVKSQIATFINQLLLGEQVHLLVNSEKEATEAQRIIPAPQASFPLHIHRLPHNDAWLRDSFPLFLQTQKGEKRLLLKGFNAWGGKFPPYDLDLKMIDALPSLTHLSSIDQRAVILEGGAVEVNGQGLLLCTEECLFEAHRNPQMDKAAYEAWFADFLGIEHTLWLQKGLPHDHTDGHIDNLARFVSSSHILVTLPSPQSQDEQTCFHENARRLRSFATEHQLELSYLPAAGPRSWQGQVYPRSYANFYIAESAVFAPVFGQAQDEEALYILEEVFPHRSIMPIDCQDIIIGGGALHCLSMYEPAGPASQE